MLELLRYVNVLLVVIFLTGCSSLQQKSLTLQQPTKDSVDQEVIPLPTEVSPVSPLPTPRTTPTLKKPRTGTSTIRGRFIIKASSIPLKGTAFYLVPGVGEESAEVPPAFAGKQDNTIQGFTNDNGEFVVSDIEPGTYYIFIWAPLRWVLVYTNSEAGEVQHPLNLVIGQNQIIELGDIFVDWP